jgi:hypothetical protein
LRLNKLSFEEEKVATKSPGKLPDGLTVIDMRFSPDSGEDLIGPFATATEAVRFIFDNINKDEQGTVLAVDIHGNEVVLYHCHHIKYLCADQNGLSFLRCFVYGFRNKLV